MYTLRAFHNVLDMRRSQQPPTPASLSSPLSLYVAVALLFLAVRG
jgi:hypothetical protein